MLLPAADSEAKIMLNLVQSPKMFTTNSVTVKM